MKRLFLFLAFVFAASIIHAQSDMTVEDLMSGDDRSLYEVLGVSKRTDVTYNSLKKIINRNYPSGGDVYSEKLDEIKKGVVAYSILSTPELKNKYDADGLMAVNDKVYVPNVSIPLYNGEPWSAVFNSRCLLKVKYPKKEWEAKHWGTVKISYVLGADKSIRDVRIEESSGYDVLDREVVKAFNKVAKKGVKHLQPSISLADGTPSDSRMELGIYFSKNRIGLAASEESVATEYAQSTGYPRGWEFVTGMYYNNRSYTYNINVEWRNTRLPAYGTDRDFMGPSRTRPGLYGSPVWQRNTGNLDRSTVTGPAKAGK